MMYRIKKLTEIEKMLALSVVFTLVLLAARCMFTREWAYLFYPWNLFLAIVPLLFSRRLKHSTSLSFKSIVLLAGWLLFLPNAPYLLTDIFHFEQRAPVPYWFDLLLVLSAAWNGLALCFLSLLQVEQFLAKHIKVFWLNMATLIFLLLCGFGTYLGRFLRFNSWNIITQPKALFISMANQILLPQLHVQTWAFSFLFAFMLWLIFVTIKKLPRLN